MMQLHSPAFEDGGEIPPRHTADGEDVSIPLQWLGVPPGTAELALVMDDPDAPGDRPWVHWVVYHIPAGIDHLPEEIHHEECLAYPPGVTQGCTSFGPDCIGYHGPQPPPGDGPHRYRLRLLALDRQLTLPPRADRAALEAAMEGHVLAHAELVGTYAR